MAVSGTLRCSVALFGAVALSTLANAQTDRYEGLANSPMAENRPTSDTGRLLNDELLFQRATQTYLWALPLINTLGMKVGSENRWIGSVVDYRVGQSNCLACLGYCALALSDELIRFAPAQKRKATCPPIKT
jgi:hypothetical protein